MRIDVITIFPDMIKAVTDYGVTGRAVEHGKLDVRCWNPRDFAEGKHRSVDDRPYGGGPGMVMMAEPLAQTVRAIRAENDGTEGVPLVYLSPQGRLLDQQAVGELGQHNRIILLAGRYEGVDERFLQSFTDMEYSIGDYVISGGELASMVVIDAVARLMPGVLGNEASAQQDSFTRGLLDCPHFTRPEEFEGVAVPGVLTSGNHEKIKNWRLKQSVGRTWVRRPELLSSARLSAEESALLTEFQIEHQQEFEHDEPDTGT